MKKNIIKYISFISGILVLAILYLSVIGVETEKFNKQIKDKIIQTNNNLKVKLNKTKPFTISTKLLLYFRPYSKERHLPCQLEFLD